MVRGGRWREGEVWVRRLVEICRLGGGDWRRYVG